MSERVVVAMSGGVDSSVAAALLVAQGFEVVGITLHLAGDASRCCSLDDADDARRVAEELGIRFYVANYTDRFRKEVMEPFADAYLAGRTPIPCVTCNRRFKFHHLLERALALGATRVATGHYARVEAHSTDGRRVLRTARDLDKDQTYFLFDLDQAQLGRLEFPLGDLRKDEVRAVARSLGLATADKPESQEICFVPDGDYAQVVEALRPEAIPGEGEVVTADGRVLGRHRGIHHFTVGQRRGLRISSAERLFVVRIDAEANRVVVGDAKSLETSEASAGGVRWISGEAPDGPIEARVRIRHHHEGVRAEIVAEGEARVRLRFLEPVRAVSPGQAAVFYRDDEVLGGGWLERDRP